MFRLWYILASTRNSAGGKTVVDVNAVKACIADQDWSTLSQLIELARDDVLKHSEQAVTAHEMLREICRNGYHAFCHFLNEVGGFGLRQWLGCYKQLIEWLAMMTDPMADVMAQVVPQPAA